MPTFLFWLIYLSNNGEVKSPSQFCFGHAESGEILILIILIYECEMIENVNK